MSALDPEVPAVYSKYYCYCIAGEQYGKGETPHRPAAKTELFNVGPTVDDSELLVLSVAAHASLHTLNTLVLHRTQILLVTCSMVISVCGEQQRSNGL